MNNRFWENKKVLLTGASGFIGSHLAEKLISLGAKVTCFLHYNSRNDIGYLNYLPKQIKKNIHKIVFGDLKDSESVAFNINKNQIIFHLGALISIPYSYLDPSNVIKTNIIGTLNILNSSKKNRIEKLIHTSTSEVYGTALKIPINECHPLQAQSPYSASKIAADKLCESYYRTYNLPIAIIRPFNVYGPRQSLRSIIPTIITQALQAKTVYLGSLEPTRDFTYVDDTVEAFIKIAESKKTVGEVINVGTGKEISIGELLKIVSKIINKKIKYKLQHNRIRPITSEVYRLVADNKKCKRILRWRPKHDLLSGLTKTIEWFKNNKVDCNVNEYYF